jgi:hypothetical protein
MKKHIIYRQLTEVGGEVASLLLKHYNRKKYVTMEVLRQLLLNIALRTAEWCTPGSGHLLPEKKHTLEIPDEVAWLQR